MNPISLPPLPPPPDPKEKGPAPAPTGTESTSSEPGGTDGDKVREKPQDVEPFMRPGGAISSLFPNLYATTTKDKITLDDVLARIKSGHWKHRIEKIRRILQTEGPEAYKKVKKLVPAVCVSGTIHGKRKDAAEEDRIVHNGLLQADFDPLDNPGLDVAEMRRRCMATRFCVAIWESPSGTGVKAIVRIRPDTKMHKRSFLAAERLFRQHGLKIDSGTKDAGRLMLVSWDPDIWINPVLPPTIPPLHEPDAAPSPKHDGNAAQICDGVSIEEIRDVLEFIPKRPPYETWIIVAFAVFSCLSYEDALALLKEWSPEEEAGEYAKLGNSEYSVKKVGFGTLVHLAKQHGYDPHSKIPKNVIPLHGGGIGYLRSSRVIFEHVARLKRLYIRGTTVVEIVEDAANGASIVEMTPERFVELVETLGKRVAQREYERVSGAEGGDGSKRVKWRTKTMSLQAAKVALQSQAARDQLPPLRQIVNAPVIVEAGNGRCEILTHGYHPHSGGTFVTSHVKLEDVPFGVRGATSFLKSLLSDFNFTTPSDLSRAVAGLISPALKMSGIITGDYPNDVTEADLSQAGKTYRGKMVVCLFNEIPSVITARKGGVGSLDESVANALLAGKLFVVMDNMRGVIDSPLLETALRGHGFVDCRGYRANGRVDVTPFIWLLSTNGAELTRDLANRSVITRIRKRTSDFVYKSYPEGDVLAHINRRRGLYLNAVFAIIREWVAKGKPQTAEARHDFHDWTRSLDWIIQNIFELPPLMGGHRDEQMRMASPRLQWLRSILLAAEAQYFGRPLTTSQILGIADDAGIEFPGGPNREEAAVRAGKILGSLFAQVEGEALEVDGFFVTRTTVQVPGEHGSKDKRTYILQKI